MNRGQSSAGAMSMGVCDVPIPRTSLAIPVAPFHASRPSRPHRSVLSTGRAGQQVWSAPLSRSARGPIVSTARLGGCVQMIDVARTREFVDQCWGDEIVPTLVEYVRIPNKSPSFDPDWSAHGYMDEAVALFERWARARLPGLLGA